MKKIILSILVSFSFMQMQNYGNFYLSKNSGLVGTNWDSQTKMLYYQTEKISPEHALIYQLISPPFVNLGYAYSDNYNRGLGADIISIICIALGTDLLSDNYENEYYDYDNDEYYYESSSDSDGIGFILVAYLIQIAKTVDSYMLAEKYNDNLYERLFNEKRPRFSLNHSAKYSGVEIAMSIPLTKR